MEQKSMQKAPCATNTYILLSSNVQVIEQTAIEHDGRTADVQRRSFHGDNVTRFWFESPSCRLSVCHVWQAANVSLADCKRDGQRRLRIRMPRQQDCLFQQIYSALFSFREDGVEEAKTRFLRHVKEHKEDLQLFPISAGTKELFVIQQVVGDFCQFGWAGEVAINSSREVAIKEIRGNVHLFIATDVPEFDGAIASSSGDIEPYCILEYEEQLVDQHPYS